MKKVLLTVLCSLMTLMLVACGKQDEHLIKYYEDMSTFFEKLSNHNAEINAIDASSPTAQTELLKCLDELQETISLMAELEVPDQFLAIDSLADEADENMKQAVSLYHQAFEGEEYDENLANAAKEYYDRTNLRIQYIITILHGEIPEGEGVTYTEESSLLGGGYLNQEKEEEAEDGQQLEDSYNEQETEDNFDTDDTVFFEE